VGTNIKILRAFFAYLKRELIVNAGPLGDFLYKTSEDIRVIALSPQRLNFLIHDKDFENSLSPRLQIWKDMFVFGCTTALRFSDISKLNHTHLETVNDDVYLCVRAQKTQMLSRVFLPHYAKDILHKYRRRKLSLFPPISKVNYNKAIKKIALLAGWKEEISKTRNRQGIAIPHYRNSAKKQHYRFCDLVSSHTMRRTAITTMLRMGMHEMNVRIISGHTAHSASFYQYVQHSESFMNEEMNKAFAKLDTFK
jgi:integrase